MNIYHLEANEEQLRRFINWCWQWYEFDGSPFDEEFRTMAQITFQLTEQLPEQEQK